jgi:hypothetical protein
MCRRNPPAHGPDRRNGDESGRNLGLCSVVGINRLADWHASTAQADVSSSPSCTPSTRVTSKVCCTLPSPWVSDASRCAGRHSFANLRREPQSLSHVPVCAVQMVWYDSSHCRASGAALDKKVCSSIKPSTLRWLGSVRQVGSVLPAQEARAGFVFCDRSIEPSVTCKPGVEDSLAFSKVYESEVLKVTLDPEWKVHRPVSLFLA